MARVSAMCAADDAAEEDANLQIEQDHDKE
jgi:hypothetical protein